MAVTVELEKIKPVFAQMIENMRAIETEMAAYAAVFLSLKQALEAGPELDKLLQDTKNNPEFQEMIATKYAPLLQVLANWDQETDFAEMLRTWNPSGPAQ